MCNSALVQINQDEFVDTTNGLCKKPSGGT